QIDGLDGAQSLMDKSLVQPGCPSGEREGRDEEPRCWMLETIHEYAREKLWESGEEAALAKEHAVYFMRLAEEAESHLTGKDQVEWFNLLEEEQDNIRAALWWGSEQAAHGIQAQAEPEAGGRDGEREA